MDSLGGSEREAFANTTRLDSLVSRGSARAEVASPRRDAEPARIPPRPRPSEPIRFHPTMRLEPTGPEEAVQLYLEDRKLEVSQSTLYEHRPRPRRFTEWVDENGLRDVAEMTRQKAHHAIGGSILL